MAYQQSDLAYYSFTAWQHAVDGTAVVISYVPKMLKH